MDIKDFNNKFLVSQGFKLVEQEPSQYFGDYFYTYSNRSFKVRLVLDRSIESIDVGSIMDISQWYDLALVEALLYDEKKLNNVSSIEEQSFFLQEELSDIAELFKDKNYPSTKKRLEKLRNERAEQMFPGIRK